jgi:hypothetical protein
MAQGKRHEPPAALMAAAEAADDAETTEITREARAAGIPTWPTGRRPVHWRQDAVRQGTLPGASGQPCPRCRVQLQMVAGAVTCVDGCLGWMDDWAQAQLAAARDAAQDGAQ